MSNETDFGLLLDATINHLETLKRQGIRHIEASESLLRDLTTPPRSTGKPQIRPEPAKPAPPSPKTSSGAVAIKPFQAPASVLPARGSTSNPAPRIEPQAPQNPAEKAAAFSALQERVLNCVQCPHLVSSRKNVVFGVGNIHSPLMFVGEAPGSDEDVQGEPFVGAAGQLLTKIIQAMGLNRAEVYIGNVLKCRPDTPGQSFGNRKPTPDEMRTCLPYLQEQIRLIQPKVIVALGATAMEGLFGRSPVYITKVRGQWQDFQGIAVMPTYHPSYVLRNQSLVTKRETWEDMLAAMEKLEMPISERQRGFFLKG